MRHLDWAEAVPSNERAPYSREDALIGRDKEADDPPTLEAGEKFEVIIGSDLLYEVGTSVQSSWLCHMDSLLSANPGCEATMVMNAI